MSRQVDRCVQVIPYSDQVDVRNPGMSAVPRCRRELHPPSEDERIGVDGCQIPETCDFEGVVRKSPRVVERFSENERLTAREEYGRKLGEHLAVAHDRLAPGEMLLRLGDLVPREFELAHEPLTPGDITLTVLCTGEFEVLPQHSLRTLKVPQANEQ